MTFKPLLAETVHFDPRDPITSLSSLPYPLYASPKLDGVRAIIRDGRALSRKLLPIPNERVQRAFADGKCDGLDGELIVGPPNHPDVYRATASAVMSRDGEPDFVFHAFDSIAQDAYVLRLIGVHSAAMSAAPGLVQPVDQTLCRTAAALAEYEARAVADGYEGVMVRAPASPYKFGRSTLREAYLLKIKRFADSEATVVGAEEEQANLNELLRDELGHAKRSTHKANKVGKGTLGTLLVRDVRTDVEFAIGSGFTAVDRQTLWADHMLDRLEGRVVRYSYQPAGVKEKPRFPVFQGFRDARDMP